MTKRTGFHSWIWAGGAALLAGAAPNLFVAAQAGYAKFSTLGQWVLLPSILLLGALTLAARSRQPAVARRIAGGAAAGLIATIGLEAVREVGFHMGAMPGDLPKLMGVLLLDRFLEGPSLLSNLAGWGYHFYNGAAFGILLALFAGGRRWWLGPIYGTAVGAGFMMSPAVIALGIGPFGVLFGPGFAITVVLAHLAFGTILGLLLARWLPDAGFLPLRRAGAPGRPGFPRDSRGNPRDGAPTGTVF